MNDRNQTSGVHAQSQAPKAAVENRSPLVFAYPRLSKTDLLFLRIGGNGLGNLLLTWARCLADAERYGWQLIWPTWGSFKPKNWRVNPHDHRTYFDLFRPTQRYVSGWKKPYCLTRYRWVAEAGPAGSHPASGSVVAYRGMEGFFAPFLSAQPLVTRELLDMSHERHLGGFNAAAPAPIGIHVRRGDFIQRGSYKETVSSHNSILPLDWYVAALQAVRDRCGRAVPADVFSDGEDAELQPLTTLPEVRRVDYGSGLADMLGLVRSRLIIASGSTFSMWGTFLGQVPTIWHPGKRLQPLLVRRSELEIEWAAGDAMPGWIRYLDELSEENTGTGESD